MSGMRSEFRREEDDVDCHRRIARRGGFGDSKLAILCLWLAESSGRC